MAVCNAHVSYLNPSCLSETFKARTIKCFTVINQHAGRWRVYGWQQIHERPPAHVTEADMTEWYLHMVMSTCRPNQLPGQGAEQQGPAIKHTTRRGRSTLRPQNIQAIVLCVHAQVLLKTRLQFYGVTHRSTVLYVSSRRNPALPFMPST